MRFGVTLARLDEHCEMIKLQNNTIDLYSSAFFNLENCSTSKVNCEL